MYIGNDLQVAESGNKIIDDISSSFNGSTTSFALTVGGYAPVPFPINTQQIYISVNGVLQEPDPTGSAGFKLSGSNIVFSSAPSNGHAFFGVILSGADYVTVGTEFPAGSATSPSITFGTDSDTGMYSVTSGQMGFTSNGVQTFTLDGDGFRFNDDKKLIVGTGSDLNIYHASGNSLIENTNTSGYLGIRGDTVYIQDHTNDHAYITCVRDGAVGIRYDNTERFATTNTGTNTVGIHVDDGATHDGDVTFTGASANVLWDKSADDLIFTDNSKAVFGTSSDGLEIFHNGSNSIINDQGTGSLLFQVGGTTKITLVSSGNLGINESSPDNKLHATTTDSNAYSTTVANTQNITNALLKLENLDGSDGGGVNNYVGIQFAVANGATSSSQINYVRTGDNAGAFQFKARNTGTNFNNLLTIKSDGKVGINAVAPANAQFTVLGPSDNSDVAVFSGGDQSRGLKISTAASTNNDALVIFDAQNADNGCFAFKTHADERMRIDSSGNVGIGTSSPAEKVHVADGHVRMKSSNTSGYKLKIGNAATGTDDFMGAISGLWGDNEVAIVGFRSGVDNTNKDDGMIFFGTSESGSNPSTRMTIREDGNVGIGTTSPAEKLDVNGNINLPTINTWIKGGGHSVLQVDATMSYLYGGSGGAQFRKADNSSALVQILDSGNIGIGTTSPSDLVHLLKSHNGHTRLVVQNNWGSNATAQLKLISPTDEFAIVKYASGDAALNLSNAANIYFQINSSEKLRIQSGGGVSFNGDTAAANALDDYEEGTWTPAYSSTGGTYGYATQEGKYTKIGNLVWVQCYIATNSVSATSHNLVKVTGLPFQVDKRTPGSIRCTGFQGTDWDDFPTAFSFEHNQTYGELQRMAAGGNTDFTTSTMNNNTYVYIAGSYAI